MIFDLTEPLAIVALAACVALAALAVATLLARRRADRVVRDLRAELAAAESRVAEHERGVEHLLGTRLPALFRSAISEHHPVPGAPEAVHDPRHARQLGEVFDLVAERLAKERRRLDTAAQAAVRGTCQSVQALSYRMQDQLEKLQHRYDDPQLTDDLLTLDHLNEQVARRVQRAAIVCGAWAGQVRGDTRVSEVVTGASSRLEGYGRIRVSSSLGDDIGVSGRAAEPVAIILTELMSNGLEHSRDDLAVEVGIVRTESGAVVVTVDDSGKGLTLEAAARGARLVSGEHSRDLMLTELGDPPALGHAAIGRVAHDHGLSISVDTPSPYGGVRGILTIPPAMVARIDPVTQPPSAMAPLPSPAPSAPTEPRAADAADAAPAPSGDALPQRRRRRTGSTQSLPAQPRWEPQDPERAHGLWADFQQGFERGHEADPNSGREEA